MIRKTLDIVVLINITYIIVKHVSLFTYRIEQSPHEPKSKMYMKLLVIVLFLCHLTCLNYAEENAEAANLEQVFKDMDTNGNNKVTKKEVRLYFNIRPLSL